MNKPLSDSNKRERLARRRVMLLGRIAAEREYLAQTCEPFRQPLQKIDRGLFVLRYVATRPLLLAGVLAFAAAVRPKRWFFMLESGLMIWRMALSTKRKLEGQFLLRKSENQ